MDLNISLRNGGNLSKLDGLNLLPRLIVMTTVPSHGYRYFAERLTPHKCVETYPSACLFGQRPRRFANKWFNFPRGRVQAPRPKPM
jgi:hypothetical protein